MICKNWTCIRVLTKEVAFENPILSITQQVSHRFHFTIQHNTVRELVTVGQHRASDRILLARVLADHVSPATQDLIQVDA